MAKLILDAGHGLSNSKRGVMDTGAVGSGTTEHAEAESLRSSVVQLLGGACEILLVPNDNKTVTEKRAFIDANILPGDLFISLHLNSGVPEATGVEVLYDDGHPGNAIEAAQIAEEFSAGLGLNNRGAKKDTEAAVGNVLILGGSGRRFLIETAFVSHPDDVSALRSKGTETLKAIIEKHLPISLPPTPMPNPEFDAAMKRMLDAKVYSAATLPSDVLSADRLAVILSRFADALKNGSL